MTSSDFQQLLIFVSPLMVGIVGFYVRSVLTKVDKISDMQISLAQMSLQIAGLQNIKEDWSTVRVELAKLIVQMESALKNTEDITVLRRDMNTIWRHLDELRAMNHKPI